jgi:putative ABC transport system permease protein
MPDQKPRDWKSEILRRLAPLKLSPEREQEIADEISQHLDDQYQDLLSAGHSPEAALQQSLDELESEDLLAHNLQAIESDLHRDPLPPGNALTTTNFLAGVLQDIRYAFRMMRNSPGFTAITILTFALGIGANTAIFTMMNGLMLHALPVRDPGQLVEILHHGSDEPEPGFNGFPWDIYETMRDGNHVLSDMIVASLNFCTVHGQSLESQTVFVGNVGGNFFESLGIRPAIGRLIGNQDIKDSSPVAVVSYSFWKSHFNSSPTIIGKKITADDKPLTIIGVTQRGFYGISNQAKQDIWRPQPQSPADRSSPGYMVGLLGRLRPGVSIPQARAELATLFKTAVDRPGANPFWPQLDLRVEPAGNGVSTPLTQMLSTPLKVLMATVGLLLLLACANLAGLLLARGASRQHEMAVRVCLGAARTRLLRQTLTESLLLSLTGSAFGIFVAYFAIEGLVRVFASGRFITGLPLHFELLKTPDASVMLFTVVIALVTGLFCGALPALNASNAAPAAALLPGSRIGETKRQRLFGKGLVASQVALALVLVSMAGVFLGYLSQLRNNLGFDRNNLLLVTLDFAQSGDNSAQYAQLSQELLAQLNAIPGVSSATLSEMSPMEGPGASAIAVADDHPEKQPEVSMNNISPDYFKTYGTPFLAGRDFSSRDQAGARTAIINETAARDSFGDENPIGKQITLKHITMTKEEKTFEVIGVVADAKYNHLEQSAPPTIYRNLYREGSLGSHSQLAIRSRLDPEAIDVSVRQIEADVLKNVPIVHMIEMNDQLDSTIVPQRLFATLSTGFGALGALLAIIGLYGLLAYTVTRRTHEIGVRVALGAADTDVMRIVLRDALWMVCIGLAIGVPLAYWGKRIAAHIIPDLPIAGPLPILIATAAMLAVGLIAAYLPARRAMRIDPTIALRYE